MPDGGKRRRWEDARSISSSPRRHSHGGPATHALGDWEARRGGEQPDRDDRIVANPIARYEGAR